jgi:hypothetical protein
MHIGIVYNRTQLPVVTGMKKNLSLRVKGIEVRPLFGRKRPSRSSPGSAGSSSDEDEDENLAEVMLIS